MKLKIGMMLVILVVAMAAPYFIKGRDGKPLMAFGPEQPIDILSSEKTRQQYMKWQDENGLWHFGDDVPEGVVAQTVNVDTAANVIRSVKLPEKESEEKEKTDKGNIPGVPLPMTVQPEQISQMMDDAANVQQLMNDRTKQLDNLR